MLLPVYLLNGKCYKNYCMKFNPAMRNNESTTIISYSDDMVMWGFYTLLNDLSLLYLQSLQHQFNLHKQLQHHQPQWLQLLLQHFHLVRIVNNLYYKHFLISHYRVIVM